MKRNIPLAHILFTSGDNSKYKYHEDQTFSFIHKAFMISFPLSHAQDTINSALSHFITKLSLCYLSSFITTHVPFNIANSSSMQDACHI